MFGTQEIILIFLAILILFGANKLPELARSLGTATGEFKKAQIQTERELKQLTDNPQNINTPKISQNIYKLAKDLNIDTTGKNEDQILEEISLIIKPKIVEQR